MQAVLPHEVNDITLRSQFSSEWKHHWEMKLRGAMHARTLARTTVEHDMGDLEKLENF